MGAYDPQVPETRVLAIASHVVSGYVGNSVVTAVLQPLGVQVDTINTVQFSNHTGYKSWTGSRATAQQIQELDDGLHRNGLSDYDMMLTGYIPGAEAVETVGNIAARLKKERSDLFWILDPVMGDNGNLYVAKEVVPAYKKFLGHADLILPNQFEAETLSGIKIEDTLSLQRAIQALHDTYHVPHIIITSVNIFASEEIGSSTLAIVGSSMSSAGQARLFKISFPAIDCYFSGTGDMFAALMVCRLRQAVSQVPGLSERPKWLSDDSVAATELPLAKAAEKVLPSMHEILVKTCEGMTGMYSRERQKREARLGRSLNEQEAQAVKSRCAELKIARNIGCLFEPPETFSATTL